MYVNNVHGAIINIAYDNLLFLWPYDIYEPYDKFNSSRHGGVGTMLTDLTKNLFYRYVSMGGDNSNILYWLHGTSV